ncbi:small-conductance mechanosensitive channel [Cenarchaeum symbiosum A]|uniref:Small-conductance mechanosensitive channel n=1 Tax=Cenarchaeum symbiosum (strain A) TaxID=414004 RepID=A0RYR2_CENSY|nr:small-conductance mechanosensitive channel [Cenarchaeum symbiosum A]
MDPQNHCGWIGVAEEDEIIGAVSEQVGQFENVSELLAASTSLQTAFVVLIVGIMGIMLGYRLLSKWSRSKRFSYTRPHVSRFVNVAILPFFAIALVTPTNAYIQTFEIFDSEGSSVHISATFSKMLNTLNVLIIGYTVAHLIPILITKREKSVLEREDYESWILSRGFPDDKGDFFHKLFKWIPPPGAPEDMDDEEFRRHMGTEEGRKYLEGFRTSRGREVGSYEELVKDPFEEWKESERSKYYEYFDRCTTGNNESGRRLRTGQKIEEIYAIDIWREEKRTGGFEAIVSGARPVGYAAKKRKDIPKSVTQLIPIAVFAAAVLGVVSWWGVDLIVLATATGGFAIGIGLALQETMQNWFAYIMIRKDGIVVEGDRIELDTGYNGYVHKITSRVTYVRHAMNESYAIIPTRQLINAQIVNYSKELKMVPAIVDVGVSYLNDPKQVASILVKVGKRAMAEVTDGKGRHLVRQKRCPYLGANKASCGCDAGLHVDVNQPVVRFQNFNDSALDFSIWVYVRDYGSQFKTKTDMRMIMYEEFKRYDIRIPWPIRTVYQGDEKREAEEIGSLNAERGRVMSKYGIGDLSKGSGDEE